MAARRACGKGSSNREILKERATARRISGTVTHSGKANCSWATFFFVSQDAKFFICKLEKLKKGKRLRVTKK